MRTNEEFASELSCEDSMYSHKYQHCSIDCLTPPRHYHYMASCMSSA
jgi:hypothetical protein